jgi:hypothetical protein
VCARCDRPSPPCLQVSVLGFGLVDVPRKWWRMASLDRSLKEVPLLGGVSWIAHTRTRARAPLLQLYWRIANASELRDEKSEELDDVMRRG